MKWKAPSIEAVVLPLIVLLALAMFVGVPLHNRAVMKRHPEIYGWPDTTASGCDKHRYEYSPDSSHVIVNDNPCFFSQYGTAVHVKRSDTSEIQSGSTVLNIKKGGPVYAIWKNPSEALVVCTRCKREDVREMNASAEG
jgi:hypothetical protein